MKKINKIKKKKRGDVMKSFFSSSKIFTSTNIVYGSAVGGMAIGGYINGINSNKNNRPKNICFGMSIGAVVGASCGFLWHTIIPVSIISFGIYKINMLVANKT